MAIASCEFASGVLLQDGRGGFFFRCGVTVPVIGVIAIRFRQLVFAEFLEEEPLVEDDVSRICDLLADKLGVAVGSRFEQGGRLVTQRSFGANGAVAWVCHATYFGAIWAQECARHKHAIFDAVFQRYARGVIESLVPKVIVGAESRSAHVACTHGFGIFFWYLGGSYYYFGHGAIGRQVEVAQVQGDVGGDQEEQQEVLPLLLLPPFGPRGKFPIIRWKFPSRLSHRQMRRPICQCYRQLRWPIRWCCLFPIRQRFPTPLYWRRSLLPPIRSKRTFHVTQQGSAGKVLPLRIAPIPPLPPH
ncbi:unnamed protein product [Closterium sp. NIES-53]